MIKVSFRTSFVNLPVYYVEFIEVTITSSLAIQKCSP